ncbi:MAG: hypothetical protein HUJ27_01960 [Rhodobacteraceae bacterium]|nr:hypothetical protein [Paracoccaceae bacterium]
MDDNAPNTEEAGLRFLRRLVTVLTATMIGGLLVLIVLFVTRFPDSGPSPLPDSVTLPDGTKPIAVTYGPGWYAVVTDGNEILIFDRDDHALIQSVTILTAK